jgi:nicotinate dehydrogenase subunit A
MITQPTHTELRFFLGQTLACPVRRVLSRLQTDYPLFTKSPEFDLSNCSKRQEEKTVAAISFTVNGQPHSLDIDAATPLLYVLQDDLKLNGPRFGCGLAQCGACTVLLDGKPIRSCVTPRSRVDGQAVTTIEGLGTLDNPHPIQSAFIAEQAMHCGFCISGPMLYGKAFIDQNPHATEADIMQALKGLLCRCYAHNRMVRALARYAKGAA